MIENLIGISAEMEVLHRVMTSTQDTLRNIKNHQPGTVWNYKHDGLYRAIDVAALLMIL